VDIIDTMVEMEVVMKRVHDTYKEYIIKDLQNSIDTTIYNGTLFIILFSIQMVLMMAFSGFILIYKVSCLLKLLEFVDSKVHKATNNK